MEKQRKKRRVPGDVKGRRRREFTEQRKAVLEGSRRPLNNLERNLEALQRLVPNGECMGLDTLFSEAADYIVGLQMTVEVMQIMVMSFSSHSHSVTEDQQSKLSNPYATV